MATGYLLLHALTIVFLAFAVGELKKNENFTRFGGIMVCFAAVNPGAFKGVYIPAVVLDIYAFVLLLVNALSKPRTSGQKLLDLLWSDGLVFFLVRNITFNFSGKRLIPSVWA